MGQVPQNSVLNGADSEIVVLEARFEVGARDLGDNRAESPELVRHGDGSEKIRSLEWLSSHNT